jgi:hypothetical protein
MAYRRVGHHGVVPERNRVTPMGEVVAIALRGAWTGNRGIIHNGREIVRFHGGDHWVTCALRFHGRHSELWRPGRFTWLFFHDEAVSFAAGHRPCGECRHRAYTAYRDAWLTSVNGEASARQMSKQLHDERMIKHTRRRRSHELAWRSLPDGTFVRRADATATVLGDRLVDWTEHGYGVSHPRPARGTATVVTPPATVAILRAGYPVQIDDSAVRRSSSSPGE